VGNLLLHRWWWHWLVLRLNDLLLHRRWWQWVLLQLNDLLPVLIMLT
jgi:hypothetical protein